MEWVRRASAAVLCLAIAAAGTGFGSTASAALPADSVLRPPDPGLVHRWAAFNQVPPNFSPAQAAAAAPSFDLATVKLKPSTPAVIAAMRSANPQLQVLVYHNGAFAQKNEGTKYPAAWYARDANGNKVVQTVFGNYLMDVSHPEWVAEVVRQCRAAKASTGADGCYTDMQMTAPLCENYANGGKPINPATGQVWTFPDFQVAVERIADAVRNGVPGPYGANGVARGKRWFAVSGRVVQDAHQPRRRRSFRDLAPRPRPVGQPVAEPGRLEARRGHGRQRRSRGAGRDGRDQAVAERPGPGSHTADGLVGPLNQMCLPCRNVSDRHNGSGGTSADY